MFPLCFLFFFYYYYFFVNRHQLNTCRGLFVLLLRTNILALRANSQLLRPQQLIPNVQMLIVSIGNLIFVLHVCVVLRVSASCFWVAIESAPVYFHNWSLTQDHVLTTISRGTFGIWSSASRRYATMEATQPRGNSFRSTLNVEFTKSCCTCVSHSYGSS